MKLPVKTRGIIQISFWALLSLVVFSCDTGDSAKNPNDQARVPQGCTVITISKGSGVFLAGNDDYVNPDSYYWVQQGDSSGYGVIWIGEPDNPQQGVNEKGLAYDANGLPRYEVNPHPERIPVKGEYYHNYLMQILHECSTVTEVIEWANNHQRFPYMHDQMHFADKTGDAVIISAGEDGEMVFTRKPPGEGFLVSTNFNVANPLNGYDYPCWRFDKATEMLGQLINKKVPVSYKDVASVMDAVHQEASSWTIETLVADLTNGVIYLYYFYQFDYPVIINIKEELANPREAGPLSKLFPENVQQEAAKRYREVTKTIRLNNVIGGSWASLIIFSLVVLFILPGSGKGFKFWIPAVIVFGPVALLVKFLTRGSGLSIWQKALIETTGNLVPVVVAFLVSQVILVLEAVSGGVSQQVQLLYIIVLPLLFAWIMFQGPLLTLTGGKNYFRFLIQRLPQVLAVTLIQLGGIFSIAMPLVNKTLAMSQIIPLSPWIVMTWWAIILTGSVIGGIMVFFYELWAVKRSYQAWNVFIKGEGEVITPGWGKIWWWVMVSVMILIAGMVAGIVLMKMMAG